MTNFEGFEGQHRIPIVLGITGHRDIPEYSVNKIEQVLKSYFLQLKQKHPNTPIVLLTPLAEGADRLVGKIAIQCGIKLIVPMPFRKQLYIEDFNSSESINEFENLLEQAIRIHELPLFPGLTEESVRNCTEDRAKQYAAVGAYVAKHCHLLIALWDGVTTPEKTGGTAQVVHFKCNGIPYPYSSTNSVLEPKEIGRVYHILIPRLSNPNPVGRLYHGQHVEEDMSRSKSEGTFDLILKNIDEFNHELLKREHKLNSIQSKQFVLGGDIALVNVLSKELKSILEDYAYVDSLAIYLNERRRTAIKLLFLFAFLAVLSTQVYGLWKATELLFVYPVVILLVSIVFFVKNKDYNTKPLDYRALAEGLRIQFFWKLCGIKDDVANHYLQQERSELQWISYALRGWDVITDEGRIRNPDEGHFRSVHTLWIESQKLFYRSKAEKFSRIERLSKYVSLFFFLVGFLISCAIPFSTNWNTLQSYGLFAVAFSILVSVLIEGYKEKMAFAQLHREYERMATFYAQASNALVTSISMGDMEIASRILLKIGKEALEENAWWVNMHRERPFEVQKG